MSNKDDFLQRNYTADLEADGTDEKNSGHMISGQVAVYGTETTIADAEGEFREIIHPGAFDETDMSDVRLLLNHDRRGLPLARSRNNNKSNKPSTMKLEVNERGLSFKADLDTSNNTNAKAAYSAVDRGDLDGMSWAFYVPNDERYQKWSMDEKGNIKRDIYKVKKISEISLVNFPAYQGTNIEARSLESDAHALDRAKKSLDNEKRENKKKINAEVYAIMQEYGKEVK